MSTFTTSIDTTSCWQKVKQSVEEEHTCFRNIKDKTDSSRFAKGGGFNKELP